MIGKLQISLLATVLGISFIAPQAKLHARPDLTPVATPDSSDDDSDSDDEPLLEEEFRHACEAGSLSGVKAVLKKLIADTYQDSATPLTHLAASENPEAFASLEFIIQLSQLIQGEKTQDFIDQKTSYPGGGSALLIALSQKNYQTAHALLENNARLDLVSNQFGKTPLMIAATGCNLITVEAIVEKYRSNLDGTEEENTAVFKKFLNIKAKCKLTALDLAEQNKGTDKEAIITYLKDHGAEKSNST